MRKPVLKSIVLPSLALLAGLSSAWAEARHGLSAFGELKYPSDFSHFEYVNPDAPKGGAFSSYSLGSFDTVNPFILKGEPPMKYDQAIYIDLQYDSLMVRAYDEPDAMYGLVAESVELADDRSWAVFRLRDSARFHDGTPIRADDVVFSVNTLIDEGHPRFRLDLRDMTSVEALDDMTVRFTFEGESLRDMPARVAELPILSKAYWQDRTFAKTTLEPPLASGPYILSRIEPGRFVEFTRVEDYWAKDLPVRRGQFNFETVRYENFRDRTASMEAFKAGDYAFREEYTSKTWANEYDFPAAQGGKVVKERIRDHRPSGLQGFFLNTRRQQFQDVRVRRALDLAFDFEWMNRTLFYDTYQRMDSLFVNSDLVASGLPSDAELALLEPYRDNLDEAVFGQPYQAPKTDGSGDVRKNLRAAAGLLKEAGWSIREGELVDTSGAPFSFEVLGFQPSGERILGPYFQNLERLGIKAKFRLVDSAQFKRRTDDYDFDTLITRFALPNTPGPELRQMFGSLAAAQSGNSNLAGISDPAVDALIEKIVAAGSREELKAATGALDRIVMHGGYLIPNWYSGYHRLAYWNRFGKPAVKPQYDRGVVRTWWVDPMKEAALESE